MLAKILQVMVHAGHETLWNLLLDRLHHPERYLQEVSEARIVKETDDLIVRELKLHGNLVKERISINPYAGELRHELLEHPQFTGIIVARILPTARQSPVAPHYLEYELELQRKSFQLEGLVKAEEEIVAEFETEMHQLKSRAEEMDSRK